MNKKYLVGILLLITLTSFNTFGQSAPIKIALEPLTISGLNGLQSFAVGQHSGRWLIVGGRLDGLHQRQPFAAFGADGINDQLIVIDPVTQQKWVAPLSSLPTSIQEQLSSTNMEFHQEGDFLYCLGGYGYSPTKGDHTTYSNLTAIKVSAVIDAIISNNSFLPYFRQITDTKFQVTGGRLKKINSEYYLMGGQKFIGRYNPMGPNHGPGFVQEYTNSIRKFSILDNGSSITIKHITSYADSINLHRRDYNAEPQILPNGEEGITMFSGVFQPIVDLPYLNSVTIDSQGYTMDNSFQQYYNHYHCAVLPMYSASNNEMHNIFFGGIAQYYDDLGVLVQDNNVPFVKTIARVTRDASGTLAEYKLPVEMPILLGAGAEFILNRNIPHYDNEVLKLDDIATDSTLVGYIYGGISSTERNIFFSNTGTQTIANSQIFKVYVIKNRTTDIDKLNEQSIGALHMQVFPNPNDGNFTINFHLSKMSEIKIIIQDIKGKFIENATIKNLKLGKNTYSKKLEGLVNGGVYFVTLNTGTEKVTQKIIVEN